MEFKNADVVGMEHAIRGMRNPKESWNKSDSKNIPIEDRPGFSKFIIGDNDLKLMQTLIKAGPEHRKFMRQIVVYVDISAPLYWWKEFDTYKVGTVANSTSTMHKITSKPITMECFEIDDIKDFEKNYLQTVINMCEDYRTKYLESKDYNVWKALIRLLPESWIQTRTISMNYENLLAMCSKGQRRFHKLTEWSKSFIDFARKLPYAQELIFLDELN
jgi:hypothetical protein